MVCLVLAVMSCRSDRKKHSWFPSSPRTNKRSLRPASWQPFTSRESLPPPYILPTLSPHLCRCCWAAVALPVATATSHPRNSSETAPDKSRAGSLPFQPPPCSADSSRFCQKQASFSSRFYQIVVSLPSESVSPSGEQGNPVGIRSCPRSCKAMTARRGGSFQTTH